jgi:hypothetical protein
MGVDNQMISGGISHTSCPCTARWLFSSFFRKYFEGLSLSVQRFSKEYQVAVIVRGAQVPIESKSCRITRDANVEVRGMV